MPMAGLGSRFADAGIITPKPLIQVDGMPMFLKALSSIKDIEAKKSYIFVIQEKHDIEQGLEGLITSALPEAKVIKLPSVTRGAAETALMAREYIDLNAGTIVMDCDLWFQSNDYNELVSKSLDNPELVSGVLLTFKATSPRYSYAEVDDNGYVTNTAEKKVISDNAITGAYYFSTGKLFLSTAERLLQSNLSLDVPEYYLSSMYNILLADNHKISLAMVDTHESFGTPEELANYEGKHA